jgi:hypothetical protein
MNSKLIIWAAALTLPQFFELSAATIGPDLIQRALVDGATGYDSVYQGDFPNVGERVTDFSFFNNQTSNTRWITPLILAFEGGRVWQVTGIGTSVENTGMGVQSHSFGLQSGSDMILGSNYTFGWWNGRINGVVTTFNQGVIMFDPATSSPGFGESCPVADCSSGGNIVPVVGNNITFANNFSGPGGGLGSGNGRIYSVQFTTAAVSTPEPAYSVIGGAILLSMIVVQRTRRRLQRPSM